VIEGPFLEVSIPAVSGTFEVGTYYKNGSVLASGNPAQISLPYEERTVAYSVRHRATACVVQGSGMYTYPTLYASPGNWFKLRERRFTPNPEDLFLPIGERVFGEYEEIWATEAILQRRILTNLTTQDGYTVPAGWYFLSNPSPASGATDGVGGVPTWYKRASSTATAYPRWDYPMPSSGNTWLSSYDAATVRPLGEI
jgi:hypothetical protein